MRSKSIILIKTFVVHLPRRTFVVYSKHEYRHKLLSFLFNYKNVT